MFPFKWSPTFACQWENTATCQYGSGNIPIRSRVIYSSFIHTVSTAKCCSLSEEEEEEQKQKQVEMGERIREIDCIVFTNFRSTVPTRVIIENKLWLQLQPPHVYDTVYLTCTDHVNILIFSLAIVESYSL